LCSFVLFSFGHCFVCPGILRLTDSDYPFGIFKLLPKQANPKDEVCLSKFTSKTRGIYVLLQKIK